MEGAGTLRLPVADAEFNYWGIPLEVTRVHHRGDLAAPSDTARADNALSAQYL